MVYKSFKDCLSADVRAVFLNTAEFSELHEINGKTMPAMLDENELLERDRGKLGLSVDGTYKSRRLLYVAAADFGGRPAYGRHLSVDGRRFKVANCLEESGIYSIELEAVRT